MTSFVDLHSHLVPDVDDGSRSLAESLSTLADLKAEGVGIVITTPHLLLPNLADDDAITRELEYHRDGFERLAAELESRPGLPALGLGQEIWAPDAAMLRRIVRRRDVGLAGGRFLLVEFGFELQGTHEDVVREAAAEARGIVVAHPERYRYLTGTRPIDLMQRWRESGALLQVNAGSFSGYYGPGPERLAWDMVSAGIVDLVATDHHGNRRIGVSPREAYEALIARGKRSLADEAMARRPAGVVGEAGRKRLRSPGEAA
jgi:protein-tyrosine phosphatase